MHPHSACERWYLHGVVIVGLLLLMFILADSVPDLLDRIRAALEVKP